MLEEQPCALMLPFVLWSPFSLHYFSLFVSLFLSPKLPEVNNVALIKQGLIVKNINILKEYWGIYNLKGKAIISSGEGRGEKIKQNVKLIKKIIQIFYLPYMLLVVVICTSGRRQLITKKKKSFFVHISFSWIRFLLCLAFAFKGANVFANLFYKSDI